MVTAKQRAGQVIREALEAELPLSTRQDCAGEVERAFEKRKSGLATRLADALEKAGVLKDK